MYISISTIPYVDKIILSNLLQLYLYDFSEFKDFPLNEHGLYSYKYLDHQWTDDFRRPLIVKVDDEIAGSALLMIDVSTDITVFSQAKKTNVISEFFIMKKFRRKGIGKQLALYLFDEYEGIWEVRQTYGNRPAYSFWKNVISEYTRGSYYEIILKNENWNGPVMVYQS